MDMRGSGIYVEHVGGLNWECPECGFDNKNADGTIDDWKNLFSTCESCEYEYEFPEPEDDDY